MLAFQVLISDLHSEIAMREHRTLMPPAIAINQRDRFNIWSGNLGALQQGRASLDFRLRDSTLMRTTILKFLNQLDRTLNKSKYLSFPFY